MANKPMVTLELAGDEKKLTEAFDRVGDASKNMADKVESSSKQMDDTSSSLDSLGEATDSSEQKFQGFADTLTGTQDIMTGFREGDIVGMATGFADLAGGLTEFVVPALSAFASFLAGPLRAAMSFIAAHPLLIVLGLLAVAFVTLWSTSEKFRDVVMSVFRTVGDFISNVFGGVIRWIVDRWNGLVDFFKSIPQKIGNALGSLGNVIGDVFKGAINFLIGILNWGIDRLNDLIHGINVVSPFDDIPGIPHIPRLHGGGVVPGMLGSEQLAILQAGERVTPRGQGGGGGMALIVGGNVDSVMGSAIDNLIRTGEITLVEVPA